MIDLGFDASIPKDAVLALYMQIVWLVEHMATLSESNFVILAYMNHPRCVGPTVVTLTCFLFLLGLRCDSPLTHRIRADTRYRQTT